MVQNARFNVVEKFAGRATRRDEIVPAPGRHAARRAQETSRDRITATEIGKQITDLATALAAAQGEIKAASKDATNPHFGSRYATLDGSWPDRRGLRVRTILSAVGKRLANGCFRGRR